MLHWTLHLNGGAQRSCHTAVVVENKVYCFEIEKVNRMCGQIEVHIFNTVSLRWVKVPPPVSTGQGEPPLEVSSGHTAVLIEDIAYVCGLRMGTKCNTAEQVLYAFDVDTHRWFQPKVSGTVPNAMYGHSACVLGKVMYIYGMHRFTYYNDTYFGVYKIDTTTMVWSLINTRGTPPTRSSDHSATIIGTKMFVFGSHSSAMPWYHYNNYIRVFDTETNCWLTTPSAQPLPYGRWDDVQHAAIACNGELYIFISCRKPFEQTTWSNDLWKLNPETFSWKKVELKGKGPAGDIRMCCRTVGDRIVLFTGHNGWVWVRDDPHDDLYILDFSPSLKTLCKLAFIGYGLEKSGLPHNIKRELAAMTTNSN